MLHLDYLSCLLTIVSTVMVGRRLWQGWVVAGVNSVIISLIGLKTGQLGFVPANVFCISLYFYNILSWRQKSPSVTGSASLNAQAAAPHKPRRFAFRSTFAGDEPTRNRIRSRAVPNQRKSGTPY